MNDKQQLAAMGEELRLTEEQAKVLAERMPKTGILQSLDDEPMCAEIRINEAMARGADIGGLIDRCLPYTVEHQSLCMAKRIEELEAQVLALTAPEGWQLVPVEPTKAMLEAFHEAHEEWESGNNWQLDCPDHQWAAMLAAAPSLDSAK